MDIKGDEVEKASLYLLELQKWLQSKPSSQLIRDKYEDEVQQQLFPLILAILGKQKRDPSEVVELALRLGFLMGVKAQAEFPQVPDIFEP